MAVKVLGTGPVLYRVFVQDVGRTGYSGMRDCKASSPQEAIRLLLEFQHERPGEWKYIAIPHSRRDLWPNGQTGAVTKEALNYA